MKSVLLWVACMGLMACAQKPIIDTQGKSMAQYEQDLAACKDYAKQVAVGNRIATGAAAGAVVGAVIGAVAGDSELAQRAAGVGAVSGAAKGTGRGLSEKQRVVYNCLRNRGYAVLN